MHLNIFSYVIFMRISSLLRINEVDSEISLQKRKYRKELYLPL